MNVNSTLEAPKQGPQAQAQTAQVLPGEHPMRGGDGVAPGAVLTKVSIVIPVYNEEATVQHLIGLVVNAKLPSGVGREIICVNDCSKDGTKAKLDELPTIFPGVDF